MRHYVTDTHPLVWYILGELPDGVEDVFTSAERGESAIFIPTIVLAECLYLVDDGTIALDFDDLLASIKSSRNFVPASFDFSVMELLPGIRLKELHDRIIVATAKRLNAVLITKDKTIRESKIVETIW
ncbi:type II toxin-antitoxin system VapC family toxin [Methanothrix sp.]|uniref:type II toxin-antitoxin system VapC family toxin n=1 Tax=Methanothrix sp. TaxID=90426 RepID=UPI0034E195DF